MTAARAPRTGARRFSRIRVHCTLRDRRLFLLQSRVMEASERRAVIALLNNPLRRAGLSARVEWPGTTRAQGPRPQPSPLHQLQGAERAGVRPHRVGLDAALVAPAQVRADREIPSGRMVVRPPIGRFETRLRQERYPIAAMTPTAPLWWRRASAAQSFPPSTTSRSWERMKDRMRQDDKPEPLPPQPRR